MTNTDKMRESFEKWASDDGRWPQAIERNGDEYKFMRTAVDWRVWQAAHAAALPPGFVAVPVEDAKNAERYRFLSVRLCASEAMEACGRRPDDDEDYTRCIGGEIDAAMQRVAMLSAAASATDGAGVE